MEGYQAQELDYGISMAVSALIEAMGMHWDNVASEQRGETPPYRGVQFKELIDEYGLHQNAVLTRWKEIS